MKLIKTLLVTCAVLAYAPVMLAADAGPVVGTVAETIESGGYVYIRFEDGTWIAANTFAVAVGDKVQYAGGMEMNNFHSNTLDRTFDSILFVSMAGPADAGSAGGPAMSKEGHAGISKSVMAQAPAAGEIEALAEGKTVAAIYAESAQLKGQVVGLNAKVVKMSSNIMGKNWVTLADGTGTEADSSLMATTQELVAPGDLVTVKGTINTDVDLGYGYQYKVLLEDASFTPLAR
jgi:hypothetical protein